MREACSEGKQRFATVYSGAIASEPDCITDVKSHNEDGCFLPIFRGPTTGRNLSPTHKNKMTGYVANAYIT